MKHRTGYIFQRGDESQQKRTWYLSYRVGGKLFTQSLRDANGQAITNKRDAEKAQAKFMAGLAIADEMEVLQNVKQKIENHSARLKGIQVAANPPLAFTAAWSTFLNSPKREEMKTGKKTLASYEQQFTHFGKWMAANYPAVKVLNGVTLTIAKDYRKHLAASGRSPETTNKFLSALYLVFRVLRDEAQLQDNPWVAKEGVGREQLDTTGRQAFTPDEVKKICDSAPDDLRPLFQIAAATGLRLKDCCLLKHSDLDLNALDAEGRQVGVITLLPAKTKRFGKKKGTVTIPILAPFRKMLEELPRDDSGYVLSAIAKRYNENHRRLVDAIQNHIKSCGIKTLGDPEAENRRAPVIKGFHSFRKFFISTLLQGGTSMLRVRKMVGHSSSAMTDKYGDVIDMADSRKALGLLPDTIIDVEHSVEVSPEAILDEIRGLVVAMTPDNLSEKRSAILKLLTPAS